MPDESRAKETSDWQANQISEAAVDTAEIFHASGP
jgi:hypothetical protein